MARSTCLVRAVVVMLVASGIFLPAVQGQSPLRRLPPPGAAARPADWQSDRSLQAVSVQADALLDRAFALAEKGAVYSARAEFFQALRVVSKALDARSGVAFHVQALNDGMQALREAADFACSGASMTADVDVPSVVARHRTPVCQEEAATISAVVAMQRYFTYAEQRLVVAAGGSPAASRAYYGLGKLYTALSEQSPTAERLHGPQAMVFHQAATHIDPANYRAANELGFLLARFGQLQEAREALQQSIVIHPLPEAWHNLAVVHQRLGEHDLASRAHHELRLMQQATGAGPAPALPARPLVQWVDAATFARAGGHDAQAVPPGLAPASRTAGAAPRTATR